MATPCRGAQFRMLCVGLACRCGCCWGPLPVQNLGHGKLGAQGHVGRSLLDTVAMTVPLWLCNALHPLPCGGGTGSGRFYHALVATCGAEEGRIRIRQQAFRACLGMALSLPRTF